MNTLVPILFAKTIKQTNGIFTNTWPIRVKELHSRKTRFNSSHSRHWPIFPCFLKLGFYFQNLTNMFNNKGVCSILEYRYIHQKGFIKVVKSNNLIILMHFIKHLSYIYIYIVWKSKYGYPHNISSMFPP